VALDDFWFEPLLATAEVVVHVDDREHWLFDHGGLGDHHRPRFPVAELEVADVRGRRVGREPEARGQVHDGQGCEGVSCGHGVYSCVWEVRGGPSWRGREWEVNGILIAGWPAASEALLA